MANSKDELLQALEDYRVYVSEHFSEDSSKPVTEHDINEFGKQIHYALTIFARIILDSH